MRCTMSPETWAGDREMFVFRCHHQAKGDRWTFLVERATLEAFIADEPFQPAATFDKLRPLVSDNYPDGGQDS